MNTIARNSIIGAGVGAGLMFLLDPARGNRRRALIRDKMIFAARKSRDAAGATRRDLGNRVQGATASVRGLLDRTPVDDRILVERVRAELGRVASHPRALDVSACDGCVTLTGDVLSSEVAPIMSSIAGVRGVTDVENQMTTHASAAHVPSLQGESERPAHWGVWRRSGWSPTAMLAGCAALAAAVVGVAALRPVETRSRDFRSA
jgi:hypothetical protein